MNKQIIICLFLISFFTFESYAQRDEKKNEHHITLSRSGQQGKIIIGTLRAKLLVESHSDNRVEIEAVGLQPIPKRAAGLKPLGAIGLENTALGLSIQEVDNVININQIRNGAKQYTIRIPRNLALQIDYKTYVGSNIEVRDISQEIEINGKNSSMRLVNITGPAVLHSVGGLIEVKFSRVNQSHPISITSQGGEIDVALPSTAKANFELRSMGGDIYTDLELRSNKEDGNWKRLGGQNFNGTLNGGGVKFSINSVGGRIYIRNADKLAGSNVE